MCSLEDHEKLMECTWSHRGYTHTHTQKGECLHADHKHLIKRPITMYTNTLPFKIMYTKILSWLILGEVVGMILNGKCHLYVLFMYILLFNESSVCSLHE